MSDFPYLAPPEDGLLRAMTDARRRRYRTAGFSTSSVAAAVVVLAALAGGGGTQSLVEQPAPQQPAVTRVVPDGGTANRTTPRLNQPQGSTSGAGASTARTTQALGAPAGGPVAGPPAAAAGGSTTRPGSRTATGPMSRSDSGGGLYPDTCPIQKTSAGRPSVCPFGSDSNSYDAKSNVVPGVRDLYLDVCSYDTREVTLHFATTLEADIEVLDQRGHVLWRWSQEHPPRPEDHSLPLTTGGCWEWRTTWAMVDQAGRKLPAGDYVLRVVSYAAELGSQNAYQSTLRIS